MKNSFKAVGIGVGVELALTGVISIGVSSSCGPVSPVSAFAYFVHMPAYYLGKLIGDVGLLLGFVAYAAMWSLIAYFILERRLHKKP